MTVAEAAGLCTAALVVVAAAREAGTTVVAPAVTAEDVVVEAAVTVGMETVAASDLVMAEGSEVMVVVTEADRSMCVHRPPKSDRPRQGERPQLRLPSQAYLSRLPRPCKRAPRCPTL